MHTGLGLYACLYMGLYVHKDRPEHLRLKAVPRRVCSKPSHQHEPGLMVVCLHI